MTGGITEADRCTRDLTSDDFAKAKRHAKYRDALRDAPTRDFSKYLTPSCREHLSTLYFDIDTALGNMAIALKFAEDYEREVSQEEAISVRDFMKEAEVVMKGSFELFVGMSE